MLFLITNQSNCFTLFVLKLGGDTTCNSHHISGYENVLKTTNEATKLNLIGNALLEKAQVQDKIGICHHLANENKLNWTKK
jgi:hypothetical protein